MGSSQSKEEKAAKEQKKKEEEEAKKKAKEDEKKAEEEAKAKKKEADEKAKNESKKESNKKNEKGNSEKDNNGKSSSKSSSKTIIQEPPKESKEDAEELKAAMLTGMDEASKEVIVTEAEDPSKGQEQPVKQNSSPPRDKTPPPREKTPPPPPQPFAYWLETGAPLFKEQYDPNTMIIDARPDSSGNLTMWVSFKPKVPPPVTARPQSSVASSIQPPPQMPSTKPPSSAGSYKPYYAGSDIGTIVTKPPSHSRPPTQSQKPPSRPTTQQHRPPTNQYRPAEPPQTAQSEMHDQLQKLAAEMAVLKATNDALENQNNEILAEMEEIQLNKKDQPPTPASMKPPPPKSAPKKHNQTVHQTLQDQVDQEEIYDNYLTLRDKYRKEREENEKLRALLVAQTAMTRQTQQQLQPIIETNIEPKYSEAVKAKDNIDRAENIIREQEKIIKKLEDLLHRSMDTVDKRYKPEIDDLYHMTRNRPRYQPMYDNPYPPPVRSAPALDYKVDMLEHSLQKEKDKSRRLDNDNASAQRELSDERSRRRDAEEKANRMAVDNSNLVRQNDDLKRQLDSMRYNPAPPPPPRPHDPYSDPYHRNRY